MTTKKDVKQSFREFISEENGLFKVRVGKTVYIVEPRRLTSKRFLTIYPGFDWANKTKVVDRKTKEVRAITPEELQKEWLIPNLKAVVNQNVRRP